MSGITLRVRYFSHGAVVWRSPNTLSNMSKLIRCGAGCGGPVAQVKAEGLTLLKADNATGYFGVHLAKPGKAKPYQAQVRRGGKMVSLGSFATAEEAALCVARTPEGQEAAGRAAPQLSEEEGKGTVLPMPPARRVRRQGGGRASSRSFDKEEGRSGSRPKWQRLRQRRK